MSKDTPTARKVARVFVLNFVSSFLLSMGIGFTLSSLGWFPFVQSQGEVYGFTLSFAVSWGGAMAGMALNREYKFVKIPISMNRMLEIITGADLQKEEIFYIPGAVHK